MFAENDLVAAELIAQIRRISGCSQAELARRSGWVDLLLEQVSRDRELMRAEGRDVRAES